MPFLKISTNMSKKNIPEDFVLKIMPVLSKSMNKPEESFTVSVNTDVFQATSKDAVTPSVLASLESIGGMGPQENKLIAHALTDFMEKELGVNKDRILLTFYDLEAFNVARGGNTIG